MSCFNNAIVAIAQKTVNGYGITHIPVKGRYRHRINLHNVIPINVKHTPLMALRLIMLIHHTLYKHCLFTEIIVHRNVILPAKILKTNAIDSRLLFYVDNFFNKKSHPERWHTKILTRRHINRYTS